MKTNKYRKCIDSIKGDCPFMYRNEYKVSCCSIDNICQLDYYGCVPDNAIRLKKERDAQC